VGRWPKKKTDLLVRHYVNEINIVDGLEVKVTHVPEACWRCVRNNVLLGLFLVLCIELLKELGKVLAICSNTTSILCTGVFLIRVS
jgi:hypothetical protein